MAELNKQKLYLFIIWEKSRHKTSEILDDLKNNFIIRDVFEIDWGKENFRKNLYRFYGLIDVEEKILRNGNGPFLVVFISDPNPKINNKIISGKNTLVNIKILEAKIKCRELIGEEFSIHGSITDEESNHNVTLLFGKNIKDFEYNISEKWNGSIKKIQREIVGSEKWDSLNQIFYVLNNTTNYVIYRNYDDITDNKNYENRDIDILADDEKLAYILDSSYFEQVLPSHFHKIKVNDKNILFDLTYTGGRYFDDKWCQDILKKRILHKNKYFVPSIEDSFFTLLYHMIYHENRFTKKYQNELKIFSNKLNNQYIKETNFHNFNECKKIIDEYMKKMSYENTKSYKNKISSNEFRRIIRLCIIIIKTKGIVFLLKAIKNKILGKGEKTKIEMDDYNFKNN